MMFFLPLHHHCSPGPDCLLPVSASSAAHSEMCEVRITSGRIMLPHTHLTIEFGHAANTAEAEAFHPDRAELHCHCQGAQSPQDAPSASPSSLISGCSPSALSVVRQALLLSGMYRPFFPPEENSPPTWPDHAQCLRLLLQDASEQCLSSQPSVLPHLCSSRVVSIPHQSLGPCHRC